MDQTQDEYLKNLHLEEDEEKRTNEINKKTSSARMDLVGTLEKDLVQEDELIKIKGLKGVDEEITK